MLLIPLASKGPWPVLQTCSLHLVAFDEGPQCIFRDPGFALFQGRDSVFSLYNRRFMSQARQMRHFCAKWHVCLPWVIKRLLCMQVFWSKMGARFGIKSTHRVENAENNHWDNRIEQKFGSGWRDWRALLRMVLFDWQRPPEKFLGTNKNGGASVREKGARACPALSCTSLILSPIFDSSGWGKKACLFPLAIIPIALDLIQVDLLASEVSLFWPRSGLLSGRKTLSPFLSEGRGAPLHKLSI